MNFIQKFDLKTLKLFFNSRFLEFLVNSKKFPFFKPNYLKAKYNHNLNLK